jgi:hypothetical protein
MMKLTPITDMPGNLSQRAILAWQTRDARTALDAAVSQLAHRLGVPSVDRAAFGIVREEPTPSVLVDTAQTAIVAEAVLALAAEVDQLRLELAAVKGQTS